MVTQTQLTTLVSSFLIAQALSCDLGWFGSRCQYKCHCTDNQCDRTGHCINGADCERGWFGFLCQYDDIASKGTITVFTSDGSDKEIHNNRDINCHENVTVTTMFLKWKINYAFMWMRLVINKLNYSTHNFLFKLRPHIATGTQFVNNFISCNNETRVYVNDNTLDIFCDIDVSVYEIMLVGDGIKSLCSVYVSGGRNVALKQITGQTSTLEDTKAISLNAVDGNTEPNYAKGSCTHTGEADKGNYPMWHVNFTYPVYVNRFELYNRDTSQERLKGFLLFTYSPENVEVHSYQDPLESPLSQYMVVSPRKLSAINKLQITALADLGGRFLTLCEVEVFGETSCPPGKYSMECDKLCNCANKTEACFVSTGGCISGCAAGYQGEGCSEECLKGRWGVDCHKICHMGCKNASCDKMTGHCDMGCSPGYKLPACKEVCDSGSWGNECTFTCNSTCKNNSCDPLTGHCDKGCTAGYKPPHCSETCAKGNWGENCSLECNVNCAYKNCNHIAGKCIDGCVSGYKPPNCTNSCDQGRFGPNCLIACDKCLSRSCDSVTGHCKHGCAGGYKFPDCYDACEKGRWGENCSRECNVNCLDKNCNHITGKCIDGCFSGYKPPNCTDSCDQGTFGPYCSKTCDRCLNKSCDSVTGQCKLGCVGGYKFPDCKETCNTGLWGDNCTQTCHFNCKGEFCNRLTGYCEKGCLQGFKLPTCIETCNSGLWGENCSYPCSHKCMNNSCNSKTGECDLGCAVGFKLPCKEACDQGRFGLNCTNTCDRCINKSCDSVTGQCFLGCVGGYKSAYCNEVCDHGWWGTNCSLPCNINCKNKSCDSKTGSCDQSCETGFKPPSCTEVCDQGTWGDNCFHPCNIKCKNKSCDRLKGHCDLGCENGYKFPNCTEACEPGTWGKNCSNTCNHCQDNLCDSVTGCCDQHPEIFMKIYQHDAEMCYWTQLESNCSQMNINKSIQCNNQTDCKLHLTLQHPPPVNGKVSALKVEPQVFQLDYKIIIGFGSALLVIGAVLIAVPFIKRRRQRGDYRISNNVESKFPEQEMNSYST